VISFGGAWNLMAPEVEPADKNPDVFVSNTSPSRCKFLLGCAGPLTSSGKSCELSAGLFEQSVTEQSIRNALREARFRESGVRPWTPTARRRRQTEGE
jgi:hypothetical protein